MNCFQFAKQWKCTSKIKILFKRFASILYCRWEKKTASLRICIWKKYMKIYVANVYLMYLWAFCLIYNINSLSRTTFKWNPRNGIAVFFFLSFISFKYKVATLFVKCVELYERSMFKWIFFLFVDCAGWYGWFEFWKVLWL